MTKLFFNTEKPLTCYSNFLIVLMSFLGLLITCMKFLMAEIHPGWFIASDFSAFNGPASGSLILFAAGAVLIAAGIILRIIKKPNIHMIPGLREISKLFILAGITCHYMMIVIYFI